MAVGIGSGIGLLVGGLLANKVSQRDVRLPLMIGAAAASLSLLAALGTLFISSPSASILLVSVTALLWGVPSGPSVATVYSVVTSRMRATGGAISIFATSVFGFGLGPLCVGVFSDVLVPSLGEEALRYALLAPIGLIPVMAISLYAAARALPKDVSPIGTKVEENSLLVAPIGTETRS
jgi:MFS family permease